MTDTISDLREELERVFYAESGGQHPLNDTTPIVDGLCDLLTRWEEGEIETEQLHEAFIRHQPMGFSIADWLIEKANAGIYDSADLQGLPVIDVSGIPIVEEEDEDEREAQERATLKRLAEKATDNPRKFRNGQAAIARYRHPSSKKHACLALYETPYFCWLSWHWEREDAAIWSSRSPLAEYDIWERLGGFILHVHEGRLQIHQSAHEKLADAQQAAADHLANAVGEMQKRLSDMATALSERDYHLGGAFEGAESSSKTTSSRQAEISRGPRFIRVVKE